MKDSDLNCSFIPDSIESKYLTKLLFKVFKYGEVMLDNVHIDLPEHTVNFVITPKIKKSEEPEDD